MSAILQRGEVQFRAMQESDLRAVMDIERRGYPQPWTEGIFRDCMRVGYYCRVSELHDTIVGYGVMSSGAGESHILNICVDRDWQNQGLGHLLMEHLLQAARRLHSHTVLLEVRPSNKPAVALYTSLGFNEVGVRRAYYPAADGREDALIMARVLV
ncbi:MAG: ribosomal protein S18-alanine N-acetyltransferase [Gammaproteobacteria bacterium]